MLNPVKNPMKLFIYSVIIGNKYILKFPRK